MATSIDTQSTNSAPAIDPNWTVRDVTSRYPATVATFKAWKVEACCDAGRTLEDASQRAGVSRDTLIAALEAQIAGQA
jgi:iron-sulfur cluster repair protein YtfE (RIC family)